MTVRVTRLPIQLLPDPRRVVTRLFVPGYWPFPRPRSRHSWSISTTCLNRLNAEECACWRHMLNRPETVAKKLRSQLLVARDVSTNHRF